MRQWRMNPTEADVMVSALICRHEAWGEIRKALLDEARIIEGLDKFDKDIGSLKKGWARLSPSDKKEALDALAELKRAGLRAKRDDRFCPAAEGALFELVLPYLVCSPLTLLYDEGFLDGWVFAADRPARTTRRASES